MPFIRFAYSDSAGAARSVQSSGDNINHFNAVRLRVNGNGMLKMRIFSLDDAKSRVIADIKMSPNPGKLITKLTNLMTERASLEIKTTSINDYFKINRIILFSREVFSSHPN